MLVGVYESCNNLKVLQRDRVLILSTDGANLRQSVKVKVNCVSETGEWPAQEKSTQWLHHSLTWIVHALCAVIYLRILFSCCAVTASVSTVFRSGGDRVDPRHAQSARKYFQWLSPHAIWLWETCLTTWEERRVRKKTQDLKKCAVCTMRNSSSSVRKINSSSVWYVGIHKNIKNTTVYQSMKQQNRIGWVYVYIYIYVCMLQELQHLVLLLMTLMGFWNDCTSIVQYPPYRTYDSGINYVSRQSFKQWLLVITGPYSHALCLPRGQVCSIK